MKLSNRMSVKIVAIVIAIYTVLAGFLWLLDEMLANLRKVSFH